MPISPVMVNGGTERAVEIAFLRENMPSESVFVADIGSTDSQYLSWLSEGRLVACFDPRGPGRTLTQGCRHFPYLIGGEFSESLFERRFDVIVCVSTLDHIGLQAYGLAGGEATVAKALDDMSYMLKPRGQLIITVPVGKPEVTLHPDGGQRVFSPYELINLTVDNGEWDTGHYEFWRLESGDRYVSRSGAQVQSSRYHDYRAGAVGCYVFESRYWG